jgi:hypothetical protein
MEQRRARRILAALLLRRHEIAVESPTTRVRCETLGYLYYLLVPRAGEIKNIHMIEGK